MPISILGDGSITGITSGGLPDGIVTNNDLATGIDATKLTGTLADARFPATLPAVSGASLTALPAGNLTGVLPALNGSALTGVGVDGIVSTANATAITIDVNENVGIGTASPQNFLHVQSGDSTNDNYRTGGDSPLIVEGTTASYIQFVADANAPMGILMGDTSDSAVGGVTYDANGGGMRLKSGGSNRVYVSTAGSVGIGTASPGQALDVAGEIRTSNGILFGTDTASANRMDDYEEGFWTPGFMLGSPSYNTTYSRSGVYCKIGSIVHVLAEIYMGNISFGDGSQLMRIGPLPYNSHPSIGTSFGLATSACIRFHNWYTEGSTYNNGGVGMATMIDVYPKVITNSNYIEIHISVGNNHGGSAFKNAAFHNNSGMSLGIAYRA